MNCPLQFTHDLSGWNLTDLGMGKVLTTLQGVLAALHRIGKAGFFLEIVRQHVQYQVVGFSALLAGRMRQLGFQFPGE